MKKYQIIYADCPWRWRNWADDTATRWVGNKYSVMDLEAICKLPVQRICAEDCVLFLWSTPPTQPDAYKVIEAWDFEYKTKAFCWIKQNKKSDSLFWGMGYWTRSNSEDCLLATKGHPKRVSAKVHQVIISKIGEHSKKPSEIRNRIVELMGDLPRIELFARKEEFLFEDDSWKGWDVWGNEVENDIIL